MIRPVLVSALFAALACSASSGASPAPDAADAASTDATGPDSTNTPTDGSAGRPATETSVDDRACLEEKTESACDACCGSVHEESYRAFWSEVLACTCGPSKCAAECPSFCAGRATEGDEIATCDACRARIESDCVTALDACSKGACGSYLRCSTRRCANKPEE
jgi:hypothetical protein